MGDLGVDWGITVRAITFDFWGTLYNDEPFPAEGERTSLRIKNIGKYLSRSYREITVADIEEPFHNSYQMFRDLQSQGETMCAKDMILAMADEMGLEFAPHQLEDMKMILEQAAIDVPPEMVPGAAETIAALSKQYKLAVVAGTGLTPGRVLRKILANDSLSKHFKCFSFSDETLHKTVHPDQFRQILNDLGVAPEEAVHVGDLLEGDIREARSIGMNTILFTPTLGFLEGEYEADAFVDNLSEIPAAVSNLSVENHVYGAH